MEYIQKRFWDPKVDAILPIRPSPMHYPMTLCGRMVSHSPRWLAARAWMQGPTVP